MEMTAVDLIGEILRDSDHHAPLLLYWVAVNGDRDQVAREMERARGHEPIVPWVLRSAGFDEPNAVGVDAEMLLEHAKADILAVSEVARVTGRLAVVVLSRRELGMSVSSSPILLPRWFPVDGGLTVTARIRDLTWSVKVPISDRASSVSELQRLLFELDSVMLVRAKRRALKDERHFRGLLDRIGVEGKIKDVFLSFEAGHSRTVNPSAFRPSAKGGTLVGALWGYVNATSPDKLVRGAKALKAAFDIVGTEGGEVMPMQGVLNRPSNVISDPGGCVVFWAAPLRALGVSIRDCRCSRRRIWSVSHSAATVNVA